MKVFIKNNPPKQRNVAAIPLLLMVIACCFPVFGQEFSVNDLKTILVGKFIQNIEWPNEQKKSSFTVVVVANNNLYQHFKRLEKRSVRRKAISVLFTPSHADIPQADLVYFPKELTADLSTTIANLRQTNTLIVAEDSSSLHNIMINLIEETGDEKVKLSFQINRPNILFEQLKPKPGLLLAGGNELDVALLYRQTELAMQQLANKNISVLSKLEQQEAKLLNKERTIKELAQKTNKLASQLKTQEQALVLKEQHLSELNNKAQTLTTAIANEIEQSKQLKQRLSQTKTELLSYQSNVNQQKAVLADLNNEITKNETLLAQQANELKATVNKLKTEENKVEQQGELLERKNRTLLISNAIIFISVIASVFITILFIKNKRVNRKLQQVISKLAAAHHSLDKKHIELESTLLNLKNTQEQLLESEKMASLGQLVTGVAHELNTPIGVSLTAITAIGGKSKQLSQKLNDRSLKKSDMVRFLEEVQEVDSLVESNLERCADLIGSFKQVSADQVVAQPREINLRDYMLEIMRTLSILLKRNQVDWSVSGDNPIIYIDPGLLSQVITNLCNNCIVHAFTEQTVRKINIVISQQQQTVMLDFSDNGTGMTDEVRKKIFEPFFTTKRGSGGTGLGMNIVYNLITHKLDGNIKIDSELGRGTTLHIAFPILTKKND